MQHRPLPGGHELGIDVPGPYTALRVARPGLDTEAPDQSPAMRSLIRLPQYTEHTSDISMCVVTC